MRFHFILMLSIQTRGTSDLRFSQTGAGDRSPTAQPESRLLGSIHLLQALHLSGNGRVWASLTCCLAQQTRVPAPPAHTCKYSPRGRRDPPCPRSCEPGPFLGPAGDRSSPPGGQQAVREGGGSGLGHCLPLGAPARSPVLPLPLPLRRPIVPGQQAEAAGPLLTQAADKAFPGIFLGRAATADRQSGRAKGGPPLAPHRVPTPVSGHPAPRKVTGS